MKWLQLGLSANEYEIHATQSEATLCSNGITISNHDICAAGVVIHRRWRLSPPKPVIKLILDGDPGNFGQREWVAALDYTFWLWRRLSPKTLWANAPNVVQDRLILYRLAAECGLDVPDTAVATRYYQLPANVVAKPIAHNEHVHDGAYFPTTNLTSSARGSLLSARSPCPHLTQTVIQVKQELRVVYSFGLMGVVSLLRDTKAGPIDIRYDSSVRCFRSSIPTHVEAKLRAFAKLTNLAIFTADILIDSNEKYWLIDVTPSGTIGSLDDDRTTLVTCCVEGILKELNAPSI